MKGGIHVASFFLYTQTVTKIKILCYLIFHRGSFPCSFIVSWTPTSGTKEVSDSPPNISRPGGNVENQMRSVKRQNFTIALHVGQGSHINWTTKFNDFSMTNLIFP